jgi:hypothetical protein
MNNHIHNPNGDSSRRTRDQRRIDVTPPGSPTQNDTVAQFRKLLAELIARRIIANRQPPAPPDNRQSP